jgi:signal peptidase I
MQSAVKNKPWKGLLASFILSGAGQFLSGARRRSILWFAAICAFPLLLLSLYTLPFIPAEAGIVFLVLYVILWLVMLYDSYRPVAPLHWWGWVLLIFVAAALGELSSRFAHLLFQVYHVPTEAMTPTVRPGDNVLVCRSAYWFSEPRRGDLIVFNTSGIKGLAKDPSQKDVLFVKRLVGLPSDVVEIGAGSIWVNNTKMEFGDPTHPIRYRYVQNRILPRGVESHAVPGGEYFVLGDNSEHSYDSRYWGTIPRSAIIGKVTKIYWPWNRMSRPQ